MTPFNADALLVMLLTFYPIVGPAALARARLERPDYFAGGEIRGTKGDKLWLPDGRKYDLILATGSPGQRWQILGPLPDAGAPGADDPFALEPGPLVPFDLSAFERLSTDPIFEPIVAAALRELGGHDARLAAAHATLAADGPDVSFVDDGAIDGADRALGGSRLLIDAADPSDVLARTSGHAAVIDANASQFPDAPADTFDGGGPGVPNAPPDVQNPSPDTQ